jgi:hypothetical protein
MRSGDRATRATKGEASAAPSARRVVDPRGIPGYILPSHGRRSLPAHLPRRERRDRDLHSGGDLRAAGAARPRAGHLPADPGPGPGGCGDRGAHRPPGTSDRGVGDRAGRLGRGGRLGSRGHHRTAAPRAAAVGSAGRGDRAWSRPSRAAGCPGRRCRRGRDSTAPIRVDPWIPERLRRGWKAADSAGPGRFLPRPCRSRRAARAEIDRRCDVDAMLVTALPNIRYLSGFSIVRTLARGTEPRDLLQPISATRPRSTPS